MALIKGEPKKVRCAGVMLASIHLFLVAYVIFLITSGAEQDWPMYWVFFLIIDFPFSLISIPFGKLIHMMDFSNKLFESFGSPFNDQKNFWEPLITLGLGGTLWWRTLPFFCYFFFMKARDIWLRFRVDPKPGNPKK